MAEIGIMAHIVAGYPDYAGALAAAKALSQGGAAVLEIQFPFSDPSADGPAIQTACAASLARGFKTAEGWSFVKELAAATAKPVFVMCYASQAFTRGVETFCRQAREAGAAGLIVPDLVIGADEGLAAACAAEGLAFVPVIAPTISKARLAEILAAKPAYVYATLRAGITGTSTAIDQSSLALVESAASSGARVMAGFGISTREQVLALNGHAAYAVIGSHFTRLVSANAAGGPEAIAQAILPEMAKVAGRQ